MNTLPLDASTPTAIAEFDCESGKLVLRSPSGSRQALILLRVGPDVIGQAVVPVVDGGVPPASLDAVVKSHAWRMWQLRFSDDRPALPAACASVVVCTRNRTRDLEKCLASLAPLADAGHEIIVVDSCPSDESTARLVAGYACVRYIREPRPGAGIARNRGLLAARNDFVAYTDDDAQADPSWLASLLRNFEDPAVALVTGLTMPSELETPAQIWFEITHGFNRGFERAEFDYFTQHPLGAGRVGASVNMAVRRNVLAEVGLFDEALGPGTPARCGEDHEFFYRILACGHRVVYEPSALVWHRHRRDWRSLRSALYGYGVGVFAWWTRALLVHRELSLLKVGPAYFLQHHVRNFVRSLLRSTGSPPLDLAAAELWGALMGPYAYLKSRRVTAALPRTLAEAAESV